MDFLVYIYKPKTHCHFAFCNTRAKMVGDTRSPKWLEVLLGEKFFAPCVSHNFEKKCDKNTFCLDCCISLCSHCLPLHKNHYLIRIRRYVYQAVIRLIDAQKVIDCSLIQPYITNSAKVVFINHKPLTRQIIRTCNTCVECDRNLQDPFTFCSLSCKVHHMNDGASGITNNWSTHNSISELPISLRSTSSRSSSGSGSNSTLPTLTESAVVCTSTTEFTKKKRSPASVSQNKCSSKCALAAEYSEVFNRRKGIPRRSPLY